MFAADNVAASNVNSMFENDSSQIPDEDFFAWNID
jgi:hypothetical protein